jgi:two-component system NtrC family sensor kinase
LLAQGLERVGFDVIRAENGAVLVEKVEQLAADVARARSLTLIVTDVRMPVMDGLAAVRALRDRGLAIPVILTTSYGDPRARTGIDNLNNRWIDKPVGLDKLRSTVAEVLGLTHPNSGSS